LQIPLKEGIGVETEGDFTDNCIVHMDFTSIGQLHQLAWLESPVWMNQNWIKIGSDFWNLKFEKKIKTLRKKKFGTEGLMEGYLAVNH
jgi:hypothetical protein